MKHQLFSLFFMLLFFLSGQAQQDPAGKYIPIDKVLYEQIVSMDKLFFDAYNTCDLKTQERIYSDSIEFFHDKAGLLQSKAELMEGTKQNICGKVTRKLVPGSIEVYPIHNYGAIETGLHQFYNNREPNAESKPSKFIVFWKKEGNDWKITKVVSLH